MTKRKKAPKPIDYRQLAAYSLAALTNARSLLEAAKLLDVAGHLSPSFVLGGLAADELGKHMILTSFPARPDTDEEWRNLWSKLGLHQRKLAAPTHMM